MILSFDPIDLNIAAIVRATRKQFGLSQTELALKLGLTQSTYSRTENCKSVLNVFQWDDFCTLFGLHHHCYKFGYVDDMSFKPDFEVPNHFQLPRRYRGTDITVQEILPTLDFCSRKLGRKALEEILKSYGLDPDYFTFRFNKISLQFQIDITKYLIQTSSLNKDSIKELSQISSTPFFFGSKYELFNNTKLKSNTTNIKTFLDIANENQNYASLHVDNITSNHIHIKRDYSLDKAGGTSFKHDSILGDFFCECFRGTLQHMSQINLPSPAPITIEHSDCFFKGAKECRYQIRVA